MVVKYCVYQIFNCIKKKQEEKKKIFSFFMNWCVFSDHFLFGEFIAHGKISHTDYSATTVYGANNFKWFTNYRK